jgi:hypothetical protein
MRVSVYHHDFPTNAAPAVLVAEIEAPDGLGVETALDFAFRRTQNIEGSWSRGPSLGDQANGDFHPSINRIAPLHEIDGKTYGLRSSMVGDFFEIDGKRYVCADFGWKVAP